MEKVTTNRTLFMCSYVHMLIYSYVHVFIYSYVRMYVRMLPNRTLFICSYVAAEREEKEGEMREEEMSVG